MSSANASDVRRLFFALWPDDTVRAQVEHLARRQVRKTGKRVAASNLHITLVFLGSVDAAQRACMEAAAASVRVAPFGLTLDRIGYWPRPRILWLGPSAVPEELSTLAGALNVAVSACGLTPERRPYQPHFTLARKVSQAPVSMTIDSVEWPVAAFSLVESQTLPEGPVYQVLANWPLRL